MAGSRRQAGGQDPGRASGFWVALGAAYLLALQMLLSGMAISAAAASPERIYGDSLCTGGAASHSDGGQDGGPHLPSCCLTGCAMFGGGTAPPTGGVAVAAPVPARGAALAVSAAAPVLLPLDQTPRRTRAPPTAG
ncbi:DUF2946 family protein [Skermanella pratensis]|uniref:DUF2946 family protein n=1 Tax=Skermanella pratensis TaxID=2233999 RepID=UPI0013017903|nr:DUF2946 family protein [Skermanella pratensis]